MPVETQKKTIGGTEYTVTTLGGVEGRKVYLRLVKALGPALRADAVGAMLANAIEALPEEVFDSLCATFAERTTVLLPDGRTPSLARVFDVHFSGQYRAMTEWLYFCVEVNFGDFLGELRERIAAFAKTTPTPSEPNSQSTSIGGSGGSSTVAWRRSES